MSKQDDADKESAGRTRTMSPSEEAKNPFAHLPPYQQVQRRAEQVLRSKHYIKFHGTETRKDRRAGRAKVRYLTSDGHVIPGRKLFKLKPGVQVHSTTLCHPTFDSRGKAEAVSLNQLRRMSPRDRVKLFNPKKAWRPAFDEQSRPTAEAS